MALITKEYLEETLHQQMELIDTWLPEADRENKDIDSMEMSDEGAESLDEYLKEMGIDPLSFMDFTLEYLQAGEYLLRRMGPIVGGGSIALRFFTLGVLAGRDNPL